MKESGSSSPKRKKLALGRGLDALLPDIPSLENGPQDYFQCDIYLIRSNRYQPRRRFSENELDELANSIKAQGIIQPLLVKKIENGYELIAGERRLRAAKRAGMDRVPVVVKDVNESELLEMSIIENIQRQDLNPMEEAEGYQRLMGEFNLTQDQVADRVGKSRSAIANFLRLRQLPEPIKDSIVEGTLSMGHARALLGAPTPTHQTALWRTVIAKKLSVRETEALVKRLSADKKKSEKVPLSSQEIYFRDLAADLSRHFGTKVQIKQQGQTGKVEIEFYSNDDLDRLLGLLKRT